ncbi:MAG: polysaccharide deacetylase family protein [Geminicoccaceae bacterium]
MRAALEKFLYWSGAYRLVGRRYAGNGVIFMLHSVVDRADDHLGEPIRCTVDVFDRLLRYMRARHIDVLSLDAALGRFEERGTKPFAVLTFDDGYRDNLTRALPVLERYAAPATIYVTTCMIERLSHPWWIGLVTWLKQRERISLEGFGARDVATSAAKIAARIDLTNWVQGDLERLSALQAAMTADGVDIPTLVDQEALSHDELRALGEHSLITIGGHTTSHPWLASLPTDEASQEIMENRRYLQDLLQQEIMHFAYPFGSPVACGERETGLVADAGFQTAVTTRHGCIFPDHAGHRFALPREGVHWFEDEISIACKSVGYHRLIGDLKRRRPWCSPVATMA